ASASRPQGPAPALRRLPSTPEARRGAAVVEFALIAPVIVFLIIGMFEMSRGIQVKQALSDAARRACRKAITPGVSTATAKSDATDVVKDIGFTPSNVNVEVLVNGGTTDASGAARGDKVSVRVWVPVSKTFWLSTLFLTSDKIESETVVMM